MPGSAQSVDNILGALDPISTTVIFCTHSIRRRKMSKKPVVPKLPERERAASLQKFLAVLNQHPNLGHFRAMVRTGPERQLALMAALERAVIVGTPTMSPPRPDE